VCSAALRRQFWGLRFGGRRKPGGPLLVTPHGVVPVPLSLLAATRGTSFRRSVSPGSGVQIGCDSGELLQYPRVLRRSVLHTLAAHGACRLQALPALRCDLECPVKAAVASSHGGGVAQAGLSEPLLVCFTLTRVCICLSESVPLQWGPGLGRQG
jgi:hypothetical protein